MKEKTKKPRYNLGQNMLWMLRQAHAVHRDDVPVITVVRALAMAGKDDAICSWGSLYFTGEVRKALTEQ